jgi:hypothetical protein
VREMKDGLDEKVVREKEKEAAAITTSSMTRLQMSDKYTFHFRPRIKCILFHTVLARAHAYQQRVHLGHLLQIDAGAHRRHHLDAVV